MKIIKEKGITYRIFNCEVCGEKCKLQYRADKVKGIKLGKLCKKKECKVVNRRKNDNNYSDRKRMKQHTGEVVHRFDVHNTYSNQTEKYIEKVIDYKSSFTGKAYIGLAKRPLMKNDNGIGYKGVLLQSEDRSLVQCSECGKWYKILSASHLKSHGLTREEYKKKYGLNKIQSLVSDTYSKFYAANAGKLNQEDHGISQKQKDERLAKGRATNAARKGKKYNTDQMKNDHGTCPLQLKHQLIEYIVRYGRYPARNRYPYTTLISRFGSINNALKEYGLPTRKRIGYTTLYEFKDGYIFKLKKGMGYGELFDIMKIKCPILNDNIINN